MRHTILYLDHAPALGGAEQSLLLLLAHLDRSRWSPHLVCADGALADKATELEVPVHRIAFPRLRRSARIAQDWRETASTLADIARSVDARLLHANTVRAAFYASPAAHMARRTFVWHVRDFWLSEGRPQHPAFDRLGKQALCASASAVIANSHAVARCTACPAAPPWSTTASTRRSSTLPAQAMISVAGTRFLSTPRW